MNLKETKNLMVSCYQKPVLAENMQVGFVAVVADGFLDHVLELAAMLLISFNVLEKKMDLAFVRRCDKT